MLDPGSAATRVVERHDVRTSPEGANGQASANHLAERGHVRRHPVVQLCAALRYAERDHLVEDKYDAEFFGNGTQAFKKTRLRGYKPVAAVYGLNDHAGQIVGVRANDPLASRDVVDRHHNRTAGNPRRKALVVLHGVRVQRITGGLEFRSNTYGDRVMCTVVAALHLAHLVTTGEGPGGAYGVERRFGAGVDEPDLLHRRDSFDKDLRPPDLGWGRSRV